MMSSPITYLVSCCFWILTGVCTSKFTLGMFLFVFPAPRLLINQINVGKTEISVLTLLNFTRLVWPKNAQSDVAFCHVAACGWIAVKVIVSLIPLWKAFISRDLRSTKGDLPPQQKCCILILNFSCCWYSEKKVKVKLLINKALW